MMKTKTYISPVTATLLLRGERPMMIPSNSKGVIIPLNPGNEEKL